MPLVRSLWFGLSELPVAEAAAAAPLSVSRTKTEPTSPGRRGVMLGGARQTGAAFGLSVCLSFLRICFGCVVGPLLVTHSMCDANFVLQRVPQSSFYQLPTCAHAVRRRLALPRRH